MATVAEALSIAMDHLAAGNAAEADVICARILNAVPGHAQASYLRGVIAGKAGRLADAADFLHGAVTAHPGIAAFHDALATALRLLGRLEEAAEQAIAAVTADPGLTAAWNGLAVTAARLGSGGGGAASRWSRLACALDPAHADATYNLAGHARHSRDPRAAPLFGRAFRLAPDASAAVHLGLLLERDGADARAAFAAAVALSPGNADAWLGLARELQRTGDEAEATRAAAVATRIDPRFAPAWTVLALLHRDAGRLAEAEAALTATLALDPHQPPLRDARWQVRQRLGLCTAYASAEGQDALIHERWFAGRRGGTFLDLGAYDGVTWSNTLFFERVLGWTGLCVEASPRLFARLAASRSCTCLNVAVGGEDGTAEFLEVTEGLTMMGGLTATFTPEDRAFVEERSPGHRAIAVPVRRLDGLLAEHGLTHIDYCSIDVEGAERSILGAIDFARVTIDVFTIENRTADPALRTHMDGLGYAFVCRFNGGDEVFVRRGRAGTDAGPQP